MKSSKDETNRRVETVLELRLAGAQLHEIKAYAAEQNWNVGERSIRRYIEYSDDLLDRMLEKRRSQLLNRHLAQRHMLFAKALSIGDYRTALAILQDEARMQSLYPAEKRELSGPNGKPIPLKYEHDIRIHIEKLLTEYDAMVARQASALPGSPTGNGKLLDTIEPPPEPEADDFSEL